MVYKIFLYSLIAINYSELSLFQVEIRSDSNFIE